MWNCYGAAETGTVCVASPEDLAARPGTVGRPLPGVRVTGRADGLLEVRSPMAGRPYTLDRGRVEDGLVFVTGRGDGRVVSGGVVVDPHRIRATLEASPGVRSVRLTRVHERGLVRFDAHVDATPGTDPEALRDGVRAALGDAHVPRRVTTSAQ